MKRSPPQQTGALLIVLAIAMLLATSGVLLARLNRAGELKANEARDTAQALAEARSALIGYAATYPDSYPPFGPGFLPCPDTNNNGSANPPCGPGALGRLPWKTLELDEVRDGSGEVPWYALSDNYRNNPKTSPMNSETPGQLTLDGAADYVVVLIAPGPPVSGQNGRESSNDDDYLEGENANDDTAYASGTTSETFNDRVLGITRAEIMAAVEKRVLGEVAQALLAYRDSMWNTNNVYPWLSPFADPTVSQFKSDIADLRREGHIPLHQVSDPPFQTSFSVSWNLSNASFPVPPSGTVTQSDLEAGTVNVASADGSCTWVDEITANCTGTASVTFCDDCSWPLPLITRQRVYTFALDYSGVLAQVTAPVSGDVRRRDVSILNPQTPDSLITIGISDTTTTWSFIPLCLPCVGPSGQGTISVDGDSTGAMAVNGMHYDLVAANDIAQWFVDENWHHLVYGAISDGHRPGGAGTCTPGTDCLTLVGASSPNNDKHALVLAAGQQVGTQTRPSASESDYFEDENDQSGGSALDDAFERKSATTTFEDRVRVVSP